MIFLRIFHSLWLLGIITSSLLIFLLPTSLIIWPFPLKIRYEFMRRFWHLFAFTIMKGGFFARIKGERPRELPEKALYVANHQSFFDIPLMITQHHIFPIMKHELLFYPIIGFAAYIAGAITVKRTHRSSRRQALKEVLERLSQGTPIQIYPEGTRSKKAPNKPFAEIHKTLMLLAYEKNIPLVPISLKGTRHLFRGFAPTLEIVTHPPLWPKDFDSGEDFARQAWEQVLSRL